MKPHSFIYTPVDPVFEELKYKSDTLLQERFLRIAKACVYDC